MSAAKRAITVRRATVDDVELLVTLIEELNAHQGDETGHVTAQAVRRDGFGAKPEFAALLAELDGEAAGYTIRLGRPRPASAACSSTICSSAMPRAGMASGGP